MVWLFIASLWIFTSNIHALIPTGANVDGLDDWSRSLPYVNLIRQSRVWGTVQNPWHRSGSINSTTGWPTNDFSVIISSEDIDTGGAYLLSAKGNATVSIMYYPSAYITNETYDTITNTLTALVNILQNSTNIILCFQNTTGPGLQDIVLLQPGYNLTSKSDMTKLILAHLSRFSVLRFMDWTNTNANFETNWNDTTSIDWPQYTLPKRNPWQTIPFIANQLNKSVDIWINLPHNATDDYILNVARIMLSELNPTNNIYVEYSNEVWNLIFPQAHANLLAANDSIYNRGDPYHFNYDNVSDLNTWGFRRTAYQIKRISDLFKIVFGEENVGPWKRVRPILAVQVVNPYVMITGLDYLNAVYGRPATFLHGIGIAPYIDLGNYRTWSNLTVDLVLDGFNSSIQGFLPEQEWSQPAPVGVHAVYSAWYGLPVHGYEGGMDTAYGCGSCSLKAKLNAIRDPRMTDICVTYLNRWYGYGFQALNWYTAGAGGINQYGSWQLLEDMRQEILIDTTSMFNTSSPVAQLPRPSPKLRAIDQVRQSSIPLNFGIPIPSSNVNATNFANHQVPYPNSDLRNLQPNSTFFYPLQILQSPLQINLIVYVAGSSGILEAAINNEQFVQIQTPQTANTTAFEAAPVIQLKINEAMVPCVVTLRLRNIISGYSIRSFDVVPSTRK